MPCFRTWGGQSGLNLCSELAAAGVLDKYGVKVIGVQIDAIERGEDRIEFKKTMESLGIEMARSEVAYTVDEALAISRQAWLSGRSPSGIHHGRRRRRSGIQYRGAEDGCCQRSAGPAWSARYW